MVGEKSFVCLIDGCDKIQSVRALCQNHYQFYRKRGILPSTSNTPKRKPNISVPYSPGNECILWPGVKNKDGYGITRVPGSRKTSLMTRNLLSWKLGRPLLPTEVTRHTCDTPACIRPEHLIVGSAKDNTRDMIERGRHGNGFRKRMSWHLSYSDTKGQ